MMLVCVMILAASVFGADFTKDFQAAKNLYRVGKYAEAEDAFVKLIEQNSSPKGTEESLAYAAYSAEQQKKSDKAAEFAGKIKDKALNTLCRMKLLEIQKKWNDIISMSKDEDFGKWPENLIYDASVCRGNAYSVTKNLENAEKDFLAATKNTVELEKKAVAYQYLGNLYQNVSKDNQKALDAYGETIRLMSDPKPSMSGGILGKAVIARAKILASQGKGEEALSEMEKFKSIEAKDPHWSCMIQFTYGEIYEVLGKNTEALESYRKAAAVVNGPEYFIKNANQKIADLEKGVQK